MLVFYDIEVTPTHGSWQGAPRKGQNSERLHRRRQLTDGLADVVENAVSVVVIEVQLVQVVTAYKTDTSAGLVRQCTLYSGGGLIK